ncbi:MAG: biopolymer transporter ExbD [Phycisphaerae bacterium]
MTLRRQLARAEQHSPATPVPLTAMIDIVFLLLIFFLFGSFDFAEQQVVAALSGSSSQARAGDDALWLQLARSSDGPVEYAIDAGPWTADPASLTTLLNTRLARSPTPPPVIIDPTSGVTLQDLVDAFGLAKSAGADQIAIHSPDPSP